MLITQASRGTPGKTRTLNFFDINGNFVYSSKSNSDGEATLPATAFSGIAVAQKICYNQVQQIIKFENGDFQICSQEQIQQGLLPQTVIKCAPGEKKIQLNFKGCSNHGYQVSRY